MRSAVYFLQFIDFGETNVRKWGRMLNLCTVTVFGIRIMPRCATSLKSVNVLLSMDDEDPRSLNVRSWYMVLVS
jgi:hypothetical protein